jgi:hypothetical protein
VGTDNEVHAYGRLINTYESHESLGKNNTGEGWGHLSWRGAIPLFVSWRQMGMAESQLMNMIDFISKVPDIEFDSRNTDSVLTKETSVERLLSPEAIVKFYLHLETVQQLNPNKTILFKQGDTRLSYQAVMNQLEQGAYIPKGETEDVIDHLKGIDDIVTYSSSQFVMNQTRYKNVVWDHDHFKQ